MGPSLDWLSNDGSGAHDLGVGRAKRDDLTSALMWPAAIEVGHVFAEKSAQVLPAEDKRVIEALSPQTSDETLALGVHVRMKAQDHLHVGSTCNIVEHRSELSIAIANEKPRSTIERGIAKLLGSPLLRGMVGFCVIDDLPRIVLHDDEGENH